MENLNLTLTATKGGLIFSSGFMFTDKDNVTKKNVLKNAKFIAECIARKLELEKVFA